MKKRIYILLLFVLAVGYIYSQNREEMKDPAIRVLRNLYKNVKNADKSVNYHAQIHIGACAFEVLVNDFIVYRDGGDSGSGSIGLSAYVNTNILKSGIQTWEVRVYPPEFQGKRLESLPEGVSIDVSIETLRFDEAGNVRHLAEPIQLIKTPQKEKDGKYVYADAGKPMAVYKGTFDAKVPYELQGWSNGQDLRKVDQDILLKMLLQEYRTFGTYLKEGQVEQIAEKILRRAEETAQSLFYTEGDNAEYFSKFIKVYATEKFDIFPLENYKMTFWGNNRMVTLERVDKTFEPALAAKFKDENNEWDVYTYYLFFYLPIGSNRLEIIR